MTYRPIGKDANPDGKCSICNRPKSRHTNEEAKSCKARELASINEK